MSPNKNNAYQFISLKSDGAIYTVGHAMLWRPCGDLRMQLLISNAAVERDFVEIPLAKRYERPGVRAVPHPGDSVREAVQRFGGGLAYFNAGEMGLLNFPLIVDGGLVAKPAPSKALFQTKWSPLNGTYSFFLQYPDGSVAIRDLEIVQDQLIVPLPRDTCGFSAPYIYKEGRHVPLKNPAPDHPPRSQEVLFPAGGQCRTPVSALGIDDRGRAVRISLVGDVGDPGRVERLPTEHDLARYLAELHVVDALYTGGSADVQYNDRPTGTLVAAPERPKSADRRWMLRAGQAERGLTVIAVLVPVSPNGATCAMFYK
jgi:hypothetical protein